MKGYNKILSRFINGVHWSVVFLWEGGSVQETVEKHRDLLG